MKKSTAIAIKTTVLATLIAAAPLAVSADRSVAVQQMADALYAVLEADRSVYTKNVVNRLQNEDKVIEASESWKDDKALPLPAQMFRMGSESVAKKNLGFSYSLLSLSPINKQNSAKTAVETEGLKAVAAAPDKPFYKEEKLGAKTFFTAVYADKAISRACTSCHNEHPDSPRKDFKLNEVMGAVVIRIPVG
jgi:Protein of unknown function (DUF3365)